MDRNTIIGLVLIAAILIGYQLITAPSKEQVLQFQHQQDSLAQVEIQKKGEQAKKVMSIADSARLQGHSAVISPSGDMVAISANDTAHAINADSVRLSKLTQRFGIFQPASSGKDEVVTIENEKLQISISTKGARPGVIRLKDYHTYHGKPLLLADPDTGSFEYRFFLGNLDLSTNDLFFTAEKLGTTGVRLKAATTDPNKYLAITYQLDSTAWFVDVNAELVGLKTEIDPRNVMFHWDVLGLNNETVSYTHLTLPTKRIV